MISPLPPIELNERGSAGTPTCEKTTNLTLSSQDKPNPLTPEQTLAIKHTLGNLLQRTSALVARSQTTKMSDDINNVVLAGKEMDVREKQLTTEPRVLLQNMDVERDREEC